MTKSYINLNIPYMDHLGREWKHVETDANEISTCRMLHSLGLSSEMGMAKFRWVYHFGLGLSQGIQGGAPIIIYLFINHLTILTRLMYLYM